MVASEPASFTQSVVQPGWSHAVAVSRRQGRTGRSGLSRRRMPIRRLARASCIVGVSSPSRSPSPSTRQATSRSPAKPIRGPGEWPKMDRRQLVQPHHVVGDHDLGGDFRQSGPGPRPLPASRSRPPRSAPSDPSSILGHVRGFVTHVRYPTDPPAQLRRSGACRGHRSRHLLHPATVIASDDAVRPGRDDTAPGRS